MEYTNEQRNEESQRKALEELVLFEGTLEELNAKDLSRQYEEASAHPYEMITSDLYKMEVFYDIIRSHLKNENAIGLVEYKLSKNTPIEGLQYVFGKKIKMKNKQEERK